VTGFLHFSQITLLIIVRIQEENSFMPNVVGVGRATAEKNNNIIAKCISFFNELGLCLTANAGGGTRETALIKE
jgi:hypothetical protein